jgi:hypothetical protein
MRPLRAVADDASEVVHENVRRVRAELQRLLAELPPATSVVRPGLPDAVALHLQPGEVWEPVKGWRLRVTDPGSRDYAPIVYVQDPCWPEVEDDVMAYNVEDCRAIAMAFLAAAARAAAHGGIGAP